MNTDLLRSHANFVAQRCEDGATIAHDMWKAASEIERLKVRVAELEAENAALADDVHCLSPSDSLTAQDCEALIAAMAADTAGNT